MQEETKKRNLQMFGVEHFDVMKMSFHRYGQLKTSVMKSSPPALKLPEYQDDESLFGFKIEISQFLPDNIVLLLADDGVVKIIYIKEEGL
jgi:hypothetical protein